MIIDIHVVDENGLNSNALQQAICLPFVNWKEGSFKKTEMDNELQIFLYYKNK